MSIRVKTGRVEGSTHSLDYIEDRQHHSMPSSLRRSRWNRPSWYTAPRRCKRLLKVESIEDRIFHSGILLFGRQCQPITQTLFPGRLRIVSYIPVRIALIRRRSTHREPRILQWVHRIFPTRTSCPLGTGRRCCRYLRLLKMPLQYSARQDSCLSINDDPLVLVALFAGENTSSRRIRLTVVSAVRRGQETGSRGTRSPQAPTNSRVTCQAIPARGSGTA